MFRGYDRPAWLLDLHKWFGTLLLAATILHVVALIGEILIPFASSWQPRSVALGVVAMYMIAAIQITSWAMKKLPKRIWHAIHLSSYVAFILVTWHAITAGTDMTSRLYGALTIMMVTLAAALGAARLVTLRTPTKSPRLTQLPAPDATKE
jgi:DMSO/TMAO reductase YedYZ heme-binding membrane subunit